VQHVKDDPHEGEQGRRRDGKQGCALGPQTASRAARLARNCAAVGRSISEKDIAASTAMSGIMKANARHTAALSHVQANAPAPPSAMRVTLELKPLRAKG
jgi:hypothetical protein